MAETKILGPTLGYNEMLDYYTTEAQVRAREEGKDFQKMPLRPSSAGQCERALAYALSEFWGMAKYEKPLKEPNVCRLLNLGHNIEYHLIKEIRTYLREHFEIRYEQQTLMFTQFVSQTNPARNHWLTGNIDFTLWSEKFKSICDSKSKGDKYSSYRESKWQEDDERFEACRTVTKLGTSAFWVEDVLAFLEEHGDPFLADNILQINLYACNDFLKAQGFDHCSLFYYNKNNSKLRELRFKPSQELANYVLAKFDAVFTAVDQGKVEETNKEFMLGSMRCAFCDYKAHCWPSEDPLRQFFKTLPKKEWPTDTHKLMQAEEIEALYQEYAQAKSAAAPLGSLEERLCSLLIEEKVRKVRFSDKEVYEVKFYKSPREHFELKRSKT